MKFTKTLLTIALAGVSSAALAAPVAWTGGFNMYNPVGGQLDANDGGAGVTAAVTGFIDTAAGTFSLASADTFFGLNWTTTGGTLYGVGTHTVNVNGDGALGAGAGNMTFTVGAGQLGGNINFAWGATTGIDVFNVWNVTNGAGGTKIYTSSNFNGIYNGVAIPGDTILGLGMVDGPFQGFSANFNVTAVPEASTYGMMLAGLGLVGFAVRRRKLMA